MKKVLLLSLGFVPAVLFAQMRSVNHGTAIKPSSSSIAKGSMIVQDVNHSGAKGNSASPKSTSTGTVGSVIGRTFYDLQSNGAVQRRVTRFAGNKTSATWTYSPDSTNDQYPNRGAGYNHFNGTTWKPFPTARVESATRTGWPALCTNASNQDVVISHKFSGSSYGNYELKNTVAGGTFTEATVTNNTTNIWTRTANSGDYVYLLDASQDTNTVVAPATTRQPVLFSKSTDGGVTFTTNHILIPNFPYSRYYRCGGDDYFIDAKDSIVAIAVAGTGRDVTVMKSMDYGVTWTAIVADTFPIAAYHGGPTGSITDSIFTNDGNVTCLIDNNGMIHVWWGLQVIKGDPNSSFSWGTYTSLSNSLVYWNENGKKSIIIDNLFSSEHNCGALDTFIIGTGYNLSGTTSKDAIYRSGMISMPQAGIDPVGNIFVVYSAIMDADTTGGTSSDPNINNTPRGQNYRDLLMMFLKEDATGSHYDSAVVSGANSTWSKPINITKTPGYEDVYPSMARGVDNNVYITWQEDLEPGTNLTNGDPISNNYIKYLEVDANAFMSAAVNADICPTVASIPVPVAQIGVANNGCVYSFTDLSTGNPIQWNWAFGDGSAASTLKNPTHTYNKGGTFKTRLDVSNQGGHHFATLKVTVDATGCVNGVSEAVNDYNFSIYPNPSTGVVNVSFDDLIATNATISVENLLGQTVAKLNNQTINSNSKISFDLSAQTNGVYFIKFQSANKNFTQKFVIEK
jgi:PKD repeat protein